MNLILIFITSFIIEGRVIDARDGNPLPFVNLWIRNTTYGDVTDEQGRFQLHLDDGEYEIVVSMMGYEKQVLGINLAEDKDILIRLEREIIEMEGVEVTVSGYTMGEGETVSRLDILREPGAAADLFLMAKGFPSVTAEAEIAALWVRGGAPDEVLVLFNGTPLVHPYQFEGTGGGMFSVVDEGMLEDAQFFPGAFPPRWGGKMSAVFNLRTREFFGEEGLGGSIGMNMAGGKATLYSRRWHLSFSKSSYERLHRLFGEDGDFTVYPNHYTLQIGATPLTSRDWHLRSFAIVGGDDMGVDLTALGFGESNRATQKTMVGSQLLGSSGNFSLEISSSINIYRARERFMKWRFDRNQNNLFCGVHLDWNITSLHRISTGAELFFEKSEIDYLVPQEPYLIAIEGALADTIKESFSTSTYWWYVQSSKQILENNLLYGVRIGKVRGKSRLAWDPRISISRQIGDWRFFAGTGRYSQYPSTMDLELNPELFPSYALHYVVGIERESPSYLLKIDTYYKPYKQLILRNTSDGYGYSKGIEVFLKGRKGRIRPRIGYALSSASRKEGYSDQLVPFEYDIRHNITFTLGSSPMVLFDRFAFELGTKLSYLSGKPYTPLIGREVRGDTVRPIWGEKNSRRMPHYMRLDLRINSYGRLFHFPVVGYIEILNLLGNQNAIWYQWNADWTKREEVNLMPRTVIAGFVWSF